MDRQQQRTLKAMIKEEIMKSVPDFIVQDAIDECTHHLKQHLTRGILLRARNPVHKNQMLVAMNNMLDDLHKEIEDCIKNQLASFMHEI